MADSLGDKLCILALNDQGQDLLSYANKKRKSGFFNDVNIQVGNKRFPCNKMVLSCYSIYFETMFESEMQERFQSNVELQGLEEQHVKLIVDFIYGEMVIIDDENVFQLLSAANYLQIELVKTFCIDYLKKALNTENCLNALNAYNLYVPTMPTDHILKLIINNFDVITKQDNFKLLSANHLTSLLEQLNKHDLNQKLLYTAIIGWVACNREERKFDFPSLFQLINLSKFSPQYLADTVSREILVVQNADCLNAVVIELTNPRPVTSDQGCSERDGSNILVFGGNQKFSLMEMQNISDKTNVSYFSKLPLDLIWQSSHKVNDFVFCIGGTVVRTLSKLCTSRVYSMNLTDQSKQWKEVSSMNERRSNHSSTLFKGNIVVSGGQRTNAPLKSVESYTLTTNKWQMIQEMNSCRSSHTMVVCSNRLYALGGVSDKSKQARLSSMETLSDLDGEWETGPSMNTARHRFAAVSLDGEIYAIGGQSDKGIEKSVEKFLPSEHKWSYIKDMNIARWGHAACVLDGKIFVIGGKSENEEKDVVIIETYDQNNDIWWMVENDQFEKLYGHSLVVV